MEAPRATTVKRKVKRPVSEQQLKYYSGRLGSIRFFMKFTALAFVLTQVYQAQKKHANEEAKKAAETLKPQSQTNK